MVSEEDRGIIGSLACSPRPTVSPSLTTKLRVLNKRYKKCLFRTRQYGIVSFTLFFALFICKTLIGFALFYFEALAYLEFCLGVDAVELTEFTYGYVVLCRDGAEGVTFLDFVGGGA